jgi:phage terminase large subunit-like protein
MGLAMSLNLDIDSLPPEKVEAAITRLEAVKAQRAVENRLARYRPYPKQEAFHSAGAFYRERLLMAANQSGKTLAGGMEAAMHATGNYPEWWQGRRFDRPTVAWVAGETSETVRDTVQRVLIGRTGTYGTGTIPKDCIIDLVPSRGVPEAIDIIRVQHASGGASTIGIKSYSDGRPKFQGETLDWVWLDEEPPPEIYIECLTRTNVGNGPVWITFTPLLGMSETVRRFLLEPSPDRRVTQMDIDEAEHFSPEERTRIVASYSPHEREARTKGVPILGSGRIFPVPEASITCEQVDFPKHWPRIGGMDFGWDHPFAAVERCGIGTPTRCTFPELIGSESQRPSCMRRPSSLGVNCRGPGRVTVGGKPWKVQASPWPSSTRRKVSTCCISTPNSKMVRSASRPG